MKKLVDKYINLIYKYFTYWGVAKWRVSIKASTRDFESHGVGAVPAPASTSKSPTV